jgi:hypothetical protein
MALAEFPELAEEFRQVTLLADCFTGLDAYPALQVEPLEFFYLTGRSLSMLDRQSLTIMMTALTWRGVVWGGWLALMCPSAEFADILAAASSREADNLWPAQCALALLEGRAPPSGLADLSTLAARVRGALSALRMERMPLRSPPAEDERKILDEERRLIRSAYKSQGAERALQVLRAARLYEFSMPYAQWYAKIGRAKG